MLIIAAIAALLLIKWASVSSSTFTSNALSPAPRQQRRSRSAHCHIENSGGVNLLHRTTVVGQHRQEADELVLQLPKFFCGLRCASICVAKIQILNPNDQPTGKWRLINELRACLVSNDYNSLLMAVAFAKTGPLLRLNAEIEQWLAKGKKIGSIFGVNHRNTSIQALQFAMEKFTTARVLFHSDDFTYHPKMYLFIGRKKCKFFLGSHNLTVGGTETNWESGTELSLNLPEDKEMFAEAMTAWDSLLAFSAQLTPELIREYQIFGKLSDETEPRRRPAAIQPADGSAVPKSVGPPCLKLKIKPPSPLPKGLFAGKSSKKTAAASKKGKAPHKHTPSPVSIPRRWVIPKLSPTIWGGTGETNVCRCGSLPLEEAAFVGLGGLGDDEELQGVF